MSYQRIGTPKIYVDNVNWSLTSEQIDSTDITYTASSSSLATGSNLISMFDMRPNNLQEIDTNGNGDTLYITIDTRITSDSLVDNNFVAILGHNFKQVGAKFQIEQSDNNFSTTYDVSNQTEVVNATYASGFHTPARNGWSLVTFSDRTGDNDNRYWRIRIQPSTSAPYASDLKIGAILMGEVISLPHSPDLQINRQFIFDGVTKQTSIGGQTYANANFLSGADWFLDPFNISTSASPSSLRKTGRQSWDMKFSYLNDTDVFPEALYTTTGLIEGNDFYTNLIAKTHGGMLPFLFQYDDTSATATDSFLWCRLNNEPKFQQVANRVWSVDINLLEEF